MVEEQVWCHSCGSQKLGRWNDSVNELECVECGGNFVEATNQGIESFLQSSEENHTLGTTAASPSSSSSSFSSQNSQFNTANTDHNAIVQQVLERVLGINPSNATISQPTASMNGFTGGFRTNNPMGIVIRQNVEVAPRNLMGLIQSVANIRQHTLSPDPNALDNAQFEQFLHHILMNESSHSGAPPASTEIISTLHREEVNADTNIGLLGDCCISLEPFEVGDVAISLTCGHKFKEEPITHWLKMHATCPVCRVNVVTK